MKKPRICVFSDVDPWPCTPERQRERDERGLRAENKSNRAEPNPSLHEEEEGRGGAPSRGVDPAMALLAKRLCAEAHAWVRRGGHRRYNNNDNDNDNAGRRSGFE